jgi:two-component system cell cycle sensor histidine kinase/response regulator CckA
VKEATPTVTILLVEDQELVRDTVRGMLEALGYKVHEASDPSQAIEGFLSKGASIDLVVTDVVMPEMSGPEFAEWLALVNPELPILFMSGYTDDRVLPYQHGRSAFIEKPFDMKTLGTKITELTEAEPSATP